MTMMSNLASCMAVAKKQGRAGWLPSSESDDTGKDYANAAFFTHKLGMISGGRSSDCAVAQNFYEGLSGATCCLKHNFGSYGEVHNGWCGTGTTLKVFFC